jgi:hypothetical protein
MIGILFGIILSTIGLILFYRKKTWIKSSKNTDGTIINIISKRIHKSDGTVTFINIPVVSFQYENKNYIFENEEGGTHYNETYKKVRVIFNPNCPTDAKILNFTSLWLLESILIGLGLLFIIFGILTYFNFIKAG